MTEPTSIWPIIATIASLFTGLVGALVIFNLQSLKAVIKDVKAKQIAQDQKIEKLIERKNTCSQDYVGKVEYIRAVNSLEDGLKELIRSVAMLNGTMKLIEKMPDICGTIARDIVKEMKTNA